MKRYFSSFMGMKESENGEWVEYPIFKLLQEKCLENDDLAKHRLDIIHERNSTIILKQKEVEEIHIKYQKIIDSMNNQNMSLQGFVGGQDNTINKLEAINKKLKGQTRFSDIKPDIFIFSIVCNIVLILSLLAKSYGGIY